VVDGMDSLTKVFLKNILLMFLIILIIFYFLGFEYLNKELLIIIAIIYMLLLITYVESYKFIIYIRTFVSLILTLFIIINIEYIPIYSLIIPIVIIIINIILYKRSIESENKLELQELFNERKKDLDRLKAGLKAYNIVGLNGDWGTGKSLIIEHLKKDKEDNYNFVEIDLLSLNLDDIKYSIMDELNIILKENGIFSKSSRRLKKIFSNHGFLSAIGDYLNIGSSNFKETLNGLKLDLCKLEKPTIIIYEDIDRINNINIIKSLFGINEKLVESTEKIKVWIVNTYLDSFFKVM